MSDHGKDPALWLRKPRERDDPPSRHAVLWPAYEFTALVFVRESSDDLRVDPFERAVLGASKSGLTEIKRQADLLGLHEQFVAFLHRRLQDRGLLEDTGRLRESAGAALAPESHVAVHLYQDPWSGSLWPRFVTQAYRRTLSVEIVDRRTNLIMGTTGRPVEVRAFRVAPPRLAVDAPTSDDAAAAVRAWLRHRSRIRVEGVDFPQHAPLRLLPDSRQLVFLCCPNHRGAPGRPEVIDPFDGPSWAPFVRAVVDQAKEGPLGSWVYGKAGDESQSVVGSDTDDDFAARLTALTAGNHPRRRDPQLVRDLEQLGHEAVDLLWAAGHEDVEVALFDPAVDRVLLIAACESFGFDNEGMPLLPAAPIRSDQLTLAQRCALLLLRHPIDIPGPLHQLSRRCPDLFQLLITAEVGRTNDSAEALIGAVAALGESAIASAVVTYEMN